MSFCIDYKREILNRDFETTGENIAFLSAIIHGSGSLHINKFGVNLEICTEMTEIAWKAVNVANKLFDIELNLDIKQLAKDTKQYVISFPTELTREVGQRLGIIEYIANTPIGFAPGIEIDLESKEMGIAYLTGLIVSSCVFTVPQLLEGEYNSYSGGYHFEMDFYSEKMAYDVMALMAQLEILAKKTTRGESYVVYIKDSNMLCDLLALTGASEQALKLYDIIVNRNFRENINRQQNCAIANIDKTVEAAQKQRIAIDKIERTVGLDSLPTKLREIAEFRINNPDYALEQIVAELGDDITKSGVNHRFRKLIEIANSIDEEDYAGKEGGNE